MSAFKRVFYNSMFHLLVFAVAFAFVYALLGEGALREVSGSSARRTQTYLSSTRGELFDWFVRSMIVGALASGVWIGFIAERQNPPDRGRAAARSGPWIMLFVATLAAVFLFYWLAHDVLRARLTDNAYLLSVVTGFAASALAYWLGTGMFVKPAMQPAALGTSNVNLPSLGRR